MNIFRMFQNKLRHQSSLKQVKLIFLKVALIQKQNKIIFRSAKE